MKGIAIWFLKKAFGIDVDGLRVDNKRLREENGRHVSRNNSLKKDKESLSEKVQRIEEEKTTILSKNKDLNKQICQLQNQLIEQKDEFKKTEEDYKSNISHLKGMLDEAHQENDGLKTLLDKANKEIEARHKRIVIPQAIFWTIVTVPTGAIPFLIWYYPLVDEPPYCNCSTELSEYKREAYL